MARKQLKLNQLLKKTQCVANKKEANLSTLIKKK